MSVIVQIHGWNSGPAVWDRLGFAETVRPSFSTVSSVDGFFHAVQRAMPSDPTVLMGWSMGGMLALETALARPKVVSAMILIGTSPTFVSTNRLLGLPARAVRRMKMALSKHPYETLSNFRKTMFSENEPRASAEFEDTFGAPHTIDFSSKGLSLGIDYLARFDVSTALDDVSCPTLWIHGAEDVICPVGCLDSVPNDHEIVIVPDAGHAPHWSRPEIVHDVIREFLDGR